MNANRRKETWINLTDPGFIEGLGRGLKLWSSWRSCPVLKFGLRVAGPFKQTEGESGQILSPFEQTFPT